MDNIEASFPIPSSQTEYDCEFGEYNSSPLFGIHIQSWVFFFFFFKSFFEAHLSLCLVSSARLLGL